MPLSARARRLPVGPLDVDVPDGSPDADPAMAIGDGEVTVGDLSSVGIELPAFAGMTGTSAGVTGTFAGMT